MSFSLKCKLMAVVIANNVFMGLFMAHDIAMGVGVSAQVAASLYLLTTVETAIEEKRCTRCS